MAGGDDDKGSGPDGKKTLAESHKHPCKPSLFKRPVDPILARRIPLSAWAGDEDVVIWYDYPEEENIKQIAQLKAKGVLDEEILDKQLAPGRMWHMVPYKSNQFPSAEHEATWRMWEKVNEEKVIDETSAYHIRPEDMPDYHYWPASANPRKRPKFLTPLQETYHRDMTQIPRFHPDGTMKTPLWEQKWYVPLDESGRFDWRANQRKNGWKPWLHRDTWKKRYTHFAPSFFHMCHPAMLCGVFAMGHFEGLNRLTCKDPGYGQRNAAWEECFFRGNEKYFNRKLSGFWRLLHERTASIQHYYWLPHMLGCLYLCRQIFGTNTVHNYRQMTYTPSAFEWVGGGVSGVGGHKYRMHRKFVRYGDYKDMLPV